MRGINAGSLDRRIRIERATMIDDGHQRRPGPWTVLATAAARFQPGRGAERFEAASRRAEIPVSFLIRWSSQVAGVTADDRVRYPATDDGTVYQIVSPPVAIGRREGIELWCVALADG